MRATRTTSNLSLMQFHYPLTLAIRIVHFELLGTHAPTSEMFGFRADRVTTTDKFTSKLKTAGSLGWHGVETKLRIPLLIGTQSTGHFQAIPVFYLESPHKYRKLPLVGSGSSRFTLEAPPLELVTTGQCVLRVTDGSATTRRTVEITRRSTSSMFVSSHKKISPKGRSILYALGWAFMFFLKFCFASRQMQTAGLGPFTYEGSSKARRRVAPGKSKGVDCRAAIIRGGGLL